MKRSRLRVESFTVWPNNDCQLDASKCVATGNTFKLQNAGVIILPEFSAQYALSEDASDMMHAHYKCICIRAKTVYVSTK